jgi:hypothetical protein
MKTAVPGTRAGGRSRTAAMKSSRSTARSVSRWARMRRPDFQVVMPVKIAPAITSGSHPPCAIFSRFAPRNARSMNKNVPATAIAPAAGQPHRLCATTPSSTVVIAIVMVTAMP